MENNTNRTKAGFIQFNKLDKPAIWGKKKRRHKLLTTEIKEGTSSQILWTLKGQ